eukprot:jgi/Mesvir1/16246/Mv08497-RA.1
MEPHESHLDIGSQQLQFHHASAFGMHPSAGHHMVESSLAGVSEHHPDHSHLHAHPHHVQDPPVDHSGATNLSQLHNCMDVVQGVIPAEGVRSDPPGIGDLVTGRLDAMFEYGYIISTTVNGLPYKGVMYLAPDPNQGLPFVKPWGAMAGDLMNAHGGDPRAPKPNKTSFNFFAMSRRDQIKAENPGINERDIARIMGKLWKEISEEEKKAFYEDQRLDKERYLRDLEQYKKGKMMEGQPQFGMPSPGC